MRGWFQGAWWDPVATARGFKAKGEIRSQFHHVIDVAATILEAAGLPEPISANGVQEMPIQGVSMVYSFDNPNAAERRETQYFEMFGNRGIYHNGWTAVTRHKSPWLLIGEKVPAFDDDVWELYDTSKDWMQANDLSRQFPEKLHELQRLCFSLNLGGKSQVLEETTDFSRVEYQFWPSSAGGS